MLSFNKPLNAVALYDFQAEEADELSFSQGDSILVLNDDGIYKDGWWTGSTANATGLFHKSYIQIIHDRENSSEVIDSNIYENKEDITIENNAIENLDKELPVTPISFNDSESTQELKLDILKNKDIIEIEKVIPVEDWTIPEVLEWLKLKGFAHLLEKFQEMDGQKLMNLNLSNLRTLNITSLSDRINLLHEILLVTEESKRIKIENRYENSVSSPIASVSTNTKYLSETVVLNNKKFNSVYTNPDEHFNVNINVSENRASFNTQAETIVENDTNAESRLKKAISTFSLSDYFNVLHDMEENEEVEEPDLSIKLDDKDMININESFANEEIMEKNKEIYNNQGETEKNNFLDSESSKTVFKTPEVNSEQNNQISVRVRSIALTSKANSKRPNFLMSSKTKKKILEEKVEIEKKDLNIYIPADDSLATFCGYLFVSIVHFERSNWIRRWCFIQGNILYICQGLKGSSCIALIPLSTYKIEPDMKLQMKHPTLFNFIATSPDKNTIINFSAESQLELISWINALVRAGQNSEKKMIQVKKINQAPQGNQQHTLTLQTENETEFNDMRSITSTYSENYTEKEVNVVQSQQRNHRQSQSSSRNSLFNSNNRYSSLSSQNFFGISQSPSTPTSAKFSNPIVNEIDLEKNKTGTLFSTTKQFPKDNLKSSLNSNSINSDEADLFFLSLSKEKELEELLTKACL
ncbi:hypothetical protein HK099_000567, partial [Clydaea vesicula]